MDMTSAHLVLVPRRFPKFSLIPLSAQLCQSIRLQTRHQIEPDKIGGNCNTLVLNALSGSVVTFLFTACPNFSSAPIFCLDCTRKDTRFPQSRENSPSM